MFEMIDDLLIVVFCCVLFVYGIVAVLQYSRFQKHKKAHIGDDEDSREWILASKFAPIPYLIVPGLFGILAIFCALTGTSILAMHVPVSGMEATCQAVFLSIIIYMIMDKLVIRQVSDAIYFVIIEMQWYCIVSKNLPIDVSENGTVTLTKSDYEKLVRTGKVKK